MKLTARVYPGDYDGNLRAYASITFDDLFVVSGLKVLERKDGKLFVSMPQRKAGENEWKDTAFPLSADFRDDITDVVLTAYEAETEKKKPKRRASR